MKLGGMSYETKNIKKWLWFRFVLLQASNSLLLLAVLTRVAFHGWLINHLVFWLLTLVVAFNNYRLLAELRKKLPAGTFGNPTVRQQLGFAGVSGALSILGFYQLATTADTFQKVTGLLCGLVCGVLAIFLLWGIQYVIDWNDEHHQG